MVVKLNLHNKLSHFQYILIIPIYSLLLVKIIQMLNLLFKIICKRILICLNNLYQIKSYVDTLDLYMVICVYFIIIRVKDKFYR